MDQNPVPAQPSAPINEDADPIVRVPVVFYLSTLPYYRAEQRWDFHTDGCPVCDGGGTWPCETGAPLAVAAGDARTAMHDAARWN